MSEPGRFEKAHSVKIEEETKFLGAFTPDKKMAAGYQLEYWNLTMVRLKGDVVLTVRRPSSFSHYVESKNKREAVWHPGVVSSVRFTHDLWRNFVAGINEANKVFEACDELDNIR